MMPKDQATEATTDRDFALEDDFGGGEELPKAAAAAIGSDFRANVCEPLEDACEQGDTLRDCRRSMQHTRRTQLVQRATLRISSSIDQIASVIAMASQRPQVVRELGNGWQEREYMDHIYYFNTVTGHFRAGALVLLPPPIFTTRLAEAQAAQAAADDAARRAWDLVLAFERTWGTGEQFVANLTEAQREAYNDLRWQLFIASRRPPQ